MKMSYFDETDTLYIEFSSTKVAETKDLDEKTTLDLDATGEIVAITLEHASQRTDLGQISLSGIAA
jgi:uncharacterized protein YuzE